MHLITLILTALSLTTGISAKTKKDTSAVLLSKIRSLTLRDGHETSHRRVSALPQLNCVGGNAQGLYNVEEMRCKNSGSQYDAEDIQWTCQATLPPEFKLGSTEVICEGYDSPEDPYVLKGSCGVEYRLMLTSLGETKYGARSESAWNLKSASSGEGGLSDAVATTLFVSFPFRSEKEIELLMMFLQWLVFAGIICVILYSVCSPRIGPGGNRINRGGWGGGGGGGGGGSGGYDDDPPPPYTPRGARPKSSSPRSSTTDYASAFPSFLAGAATGAAAGYGAGAWNANRQNRNQTAGPSNWFQRQTPTYGSPSNYGEGPSTSSPAPSSSRHESTGFGGTTRR